MTVPGEQLGPICKQFDPVRLSKFVANVSRHGVDLYRDFAWRRTTDPYAILVSEVMLQQTQVVRVEKYFERWIVRFPTIDALAAASIADVLELWQGLGYNRRALMLKRSAERISENHAGVVPADYDALIACPGIGPATAAGVLAFAFNVPATYLETNVRTVVLHELFADVVDVNDREVRAVVEATSRLSASQGIEPRTWNYALLDYGAWLKRTMPNPSRRSKHHTQQSTFEGSRRQKRAALLRLILTSPGLQCNEYARMSGYDPGIVEDILNDLTTEGFLSESQGRYRVA
jgi:A/G-specific adenine glycosylase